MFQVSDSRQQRSRRSTADTLPLTPEAYRKLEDELEQLRAERRDHGAMREDEAITEARLGRLEQILGRAEVVDDAATDGTVAIGSMVTILEHESGRTETYLIDGAHGSLDSNVISARSPMGDALIGSARGAVVHVELPRGRAKTLTVLDVAERPSAR